MTTLVTRTTRLIERGVTVFAGIGLIALTAIFCADVLARYILNKPIDGVFEMATTLFLPMVVFLGMALSVRTDTHVRMSVLIDRLPAAGQRIFRGFGNLIGGLLWAAIALVMGDKALASMIANEVSTVSFALPIFWGYAIVALGSALMAFVSLINIGQPAEPADDSDSVAEGA